ncbi:polysaccharide biosynthesis protein [Clostridium homopropionicum DSM 5847]|uniref:Polysaccharide biosynthesis protein n=1 Tax=Clostridium homopropionicum DSM 5847 TaxID=1121318 RepID=A0A0L6ZDQ4_9CLOT|nr:flippase [Clostridium homopropionicum]KOA21111.1 polysaccharide biosynthesis protein [Clostridium homopropionicum DSM 5847]SFF97024.1 Membrane protein involved in the export of O-antigen and teichoic acid [Clostridium homopropionicum]
MLNINRVARNLLSIGLSSFLAQFIMFIQIAYYARVLSVESFGIVNLAQSILVYFTMITLFGFQTLGTKEVSKDKDKAGELIGYISIIRIIVAAICFLIIIAIGILSNKGVTFGNLLIIFGCTLLPLAFNIDWLFSGLQEMQHNGIYNIIKSLIPLILSLIFIKGEEGIFYIPIFTLIGLILGVIYQGYIIRVKKKIRIAIRLNKYEIKKYVIKSTPFLISGLLSMINMNLDTIIIGFTRSEYELGIYSSAYKIIYFLINLIAVIYVPFFPLLIEYFNNKDISKLQNIVNNICKVVMLLGFPITIGGILLSKDIIILLFSDKYAEAYLPFIILLIYIFILFMRETYGYSLNAWNMERKYLKSVVISSLANLILNIIFIPKFGIVAAAVTTVISELINFIVMKKHSKTVVLTNYFSNSVKLILPILIMSGVILIMNYYSINVIINIILAVVVYFYSVIYFKYISINELKVLVKKNK